MSHSTTATTTYNLVKYSRSYAQANGASEQSGEQEWQHFTNPVILLVVDVKKSSSGDLESFRMRILWSLNSGNDAMDVDQREVVFEDLDLLTFSSVPSFQQNVLQGFPLKAVYRDAVIGIRYLHPRTIPAGGTPSYRRFQITFQSATLATSFIDSIKFICPCKANPPPPQALGRNIARSATIIQSGTNALPPAGTHSTQTRPVLPTAVPTRIQAPMTQVETFSQLHQPAANANTVQPPHTPLRPPAVMSSPWDQPPPFDDRFARTSAPYPLSAPDPFRPPFAHGYIQASQASQAPPLEHYQPRPYPERYSQAAPSSDDTHFTRPSSAATFSSAQADSSVYDSSQATRGAGRRADLQVAQDAVYKPSQPPSADRAQPAMPPPPAPAPALPSSTDLAPTPPPLATADLVASLREIPPLYDLPRAELESLVTKVVREDGFAKLLENIDAMWAVKAYVGAGKTANSSAP